MPCKISPIISILVLLLSLSLLLPPTSTRNSHFGRKVVNKEIQRTLIGIRPGPGHEHSPSGCANCRRPPDIEKENFSRATKTQELKNEPFNCDFSTGTPSSTREFSRAGLQLNSIGLPLAST